MKSFVAFIKKELTEQIRSGKLVLLCILFVLFGIMNPAVAKLTPWLMEMMEGRHSEGGRGLRGREGAEEIFSHLWPPADMGG